MNSKLALAGAVAFAGSLFLTPSAHAYLTLTVPASSSIPLTLTDFTSPPGTPGVGSLSFPKFSLPGTQLISVTLTLDSTLNSTITFTATPIVGTPRTTVKVNSDVYMAVQDAGNHLLFGGLPADLTLNPQFDLSVSTSLGTVADNTSQSTGLLTGKASNTQKYTSVPVLAEFTGGGNLTLNVSTSTLFGGSWGGGAGNVSGVDMAGVTGSVTYEYASVPEATTLLLGGMAVMPILMQRRRRGDAKVQA
jgi:hypothetical protein